MEIGLFRHLDLVQVCYLLPFYWQKTVLPAPWLQFSCSLLPWLFLPLLPAPLCLKGHSPGSLITPNRVCHICERSLSLVEIQDVYLIPVHAHSTHNKELLQVILPPVYLTWWQLARVHRRAANETKKVKRSLSSVNIQDVYLITVHVHSTHNKELKYKSYCLLCTWQGSSNLCWHEILDSHLTIAFDEHISQLVNWQGRFAVAKLLWICLIYCEKSSWILDTNKE